MPELPEVETIARGLAGLVVGRRIGGVKVMCEKSWRGDVGLVVGSEMVGLSRRGKALLFELVGGVRLMVHLRMTGQLVYVGSERFAGGHPTEGYIHELPDKHTRVVLELSDGGRVFFNDQRKFGFVKVLMEGESDDFLDRLAPEPWEMDGEELWRRLQRRRGTSVKAAILDQGVIAGVGNIYADEGLWAAGIAPTRRAGEVSLAEAGALLLGLRGAMERSIEAGGSSIRNYVKADGTRGDYLTKFAKVFGREGLRCERCGGTIEKTRVAGRGTHWCPRCQR